MTIFIFRVKYFLSTQLFILYEKFLAVVSKRQRLKILFSKKNDWEELIRKGFKGLPHEVKFASLTLANIKECDMTIGLTYEDVLFLSEIKHNNYIPIPDTECIKLCHDKYRFAKNLIEMGFGENIPLIDDNLSFPFILKKKLDSWGQNTHLVKNDLQYQTLLKTIQKEDYYCQACVLGRFEYATHLLVVNKKIVHSLTIQHLFSSESAINGKEDRISGIVSCKHLDIFTRILNSIDYEGLCCVDYKIRNSKPMIFEINPRFGGSLQRFFFSFIRHLSIPVKSTL